MDASVLQVIKEINKKHGHGTVVRASDITSDVIPRFTSGSLGVDLILGGGWPGNQWVEIVGEECLAPGTKILCSDLTWRPVETLFVGDELIGFDENQQGRGKGNASKFRGSTVTSLGRATLPVYEIVTQYGTTYASGGHMWLVTQRRGKLQKQRTWVRSDALAVGDPIASVGPTWSTLGTWESGYLAGFWDGEGWISGGNGSNGNARAGINQAQGELADFVEKLHVEVGFPVLKHESKRPADKQHWKRQWSFGFHGRYEDMRFIGSVRPRRLLEKSRLLWEGVSTKQVHGNNAIVQSVRFVGEREVVTIGTSTKTLIADGMLSHNSSGKTALAMKTIAANQQANPEFTAVWIAAEEWVPQYAQMLGVDTERILVVETNISEHAFDAALKFAETKAIDCIVIDSMPALIPLPEDEKDMDGNTVGQQARIVNKFFRKTGAVMKRSLIEQERPILGIVIQQYRSNIGVMYGPTKTTPGGQGKNYAYFARVEVRRDAWIEEGPKSDKVKVGQNIRIRTTKNKSARPQQTAFVDFYFADSEEGHRAGDFDTGKEIAALAVMFGVIERSGSWYSYREHKWQGVDSVVDDVRQLPDLKELLEKEIRTLSPALPEGPE